MHVLLQRGSEIILVNMELLYIKLLQKLQSIFWVLCPEMVKAHWPTKESSNLNSSLCWMIS